MKYYRMRREDTLHSAPVGIGHNSIVVVPGPTFGLASVGLVDESGNLYAWLMEDEPLDEAMAFARGRSKPSDWDTDWETTHLEDCQWATFRGPICKCAESRDPCQE